MDRLVVATEADSLLRAKFGSLLTSWSPNEGNYIFMDLDDPVTKAYVKDSAERGFCVYGFCEEKVIHINRERNLVKTRHLRTALHEMLHAHISKTGLDLDFCSFIWDGVPQIGRDLTAYDAHEVILDYLAFKTMRSPVPVGAWKRFISLLREPDLSHPGTEIERICQYDLIHLFSPLGEEWDQNLYRWLNGAPFNESREKFEAYYGKDSGDGLIALLVAQTRLVYPEVAGAFEPGLLGVYEGQVKIFDKVRQSKLSHVT